MASRRKDDYTLIGYSGLISGTVGVIAPFPFNMIRCLQQTGVQTSPSIQHIFGRILATQGVAGGLYRGLSTALLLYAPATAVYYGTFFKSSEVLFDMLGQEQASAFVAGLSANVTGTLLWTPMDNIVQRTWITQEKALVVAKRIVRQQGPQGLWRAYPATLGVWSPLSGVFFLSYETLMATVEASPVLAQHENVATIIAAAASSTVAVFGTNPLDVWRTR